MSARMRTDIEEYLIGKFSLMKLMNGTSAYGRVKDIIDEFLVLESESPKPKETESCVIPVNSIAIIDFEVEEE